MTRVQEATIRRYEAGDEEQIRPLFREVFGEVKAPPRWEWQFRGHPKGPSWISVAERDGTILGHHGLMRQHLNFNGREVVAAQECDAMIKEELRGGGFYTTLGQFNYAQASEGGMRALFLFPSRNSSPGSYPLVIRRLESRRIANLHHYVKRIGFRGATGAVVDRAQKSVAALARAATVRLRWGRQLRGLTVDTSSTIPPDCDAALKQIRDYEVLAVWKDRDYLRWRYEARPDCHYDVHCLRRDGETHGLVITRAYNDSLAICEVLHRRKNIVETAFLLERVVAWARRSALQRVEFNGYDNGFYDAAFAAAGFVVQPFSKYILIGRVLGDPDLEKSYYQPLNWSISWGDGDEL
jgi:hypothetical protein